MPQKTPWNPHSTVLRGLPFPACRKEESKDDSREKSPAVGVSVSQFDLLPRGFGDSVAYSVVSPAAMLSLLSLPPADCKDPEWALGLCVPACQATDTGEPGQCGKSRKSGRRHLLQVVWQTPPELAGEKLCQAPKTHSVVWGPWPLAPEVSFQKISEVKTIFTIKGYCLFHKSPRGHICSDDIIICAFKMFYKCFSFLFYISKMLPKNMSPCCPAPVVGLFTFTLTWNEKQILSTVAAIFELLHSLVLLDGWQGETHIDFAITEFYHSQLMYGSRYNHTDKHTRYNLILTGRQRQ